MIEFLLCTDEGDEALLSLDTLKELYIVPWNFPTPMDKNKREPEVRRVKDYEEEEEWLKQKEEDEKRCNDLKKAWLRDFPEVFKEDLGREDRIDIEPIVIDLVDNHQDIHVFHPKTGVDVPAYMEEAARKELQRMLNAGMIEPIQGYTENLSRGFFVENREKKLSRLAFWQISGG